MFIANAFSLQMIPSNRESNIRVEPIAIEEVRGLDLQSAIGHVDTASVVSNMLGKTLPAERINVRLEEGESIIVAQIQGGRLPEGATTLPEGVQIQFMKVTVNVTH